MGACLTSEDPGGDGYGEDDELLVNAARKQWRAVASLAKTASKGAFLRRDEKSGATALMVVCNAGVQGRWRTPEDGAVREQAEVEVAAKVLIEAGASVTSKDYDGRVPLHFACANGLEDTVSLMLPRLGKGSHHLMVQAEDGTTPMLAACRSGHLDIVSMLLDEGKVDVNARNSDNETALLASCKAGHWEIVDRIFECGEVDVNVASTTKGDTPLMAAAHRLHLKTAKEILKRGGDVAAVNRERLDALMGVCYTPPQQAPHDHRMMVELLLEHKADVNAETTRGMTALEFALLKKNTDVAEILRSKGSRDHIHTYMPNFKLVVAAHFTHSPWTKVEPEPKHEPTSEPEPTLEVLKNQSLGIVAILLPRVPAPRRPRESPRRPRLSCRWRKTLPRYEVQCLCSYKVLLCNAPLPHTSYTPLHYSCEVTRVK